VPNKLKRYYDQRHLHFITFSCYRRLQLLGPPPRRDALLRMIEATRKRYRFAVLGYVVMPEHVHLLISLPEVGDPSKVVKSIKQRSAARFLRRRPESRLFDDAVDHFWQKRIYDFNVYSERKVVEKLKYMHRNPVKRGLVLAPEQWKWSSFRFYMYGEAGLVKIAKSEHLPNMGDATSRSPT
jgi:putative transposase